MVIKKFERFINENNDNNKFSYMMLSRLQSDCDYFLGNGSGSVNVLYYNTIEEHIAEMRKLWDSIEEKPEWLSKEDIDEYEEKMLEFQQ